MTRPSTSAAGLPLLLLAAALLLGRPGAAGAQIGVSGGLNFSGLDDLRTADVGAPLENSTGYHLGAFLELGSGAVHLRPGLVYHRLGTYRFPDREFDLSAVEVPVDLRVTVLPLPALSGYVLGAPVFTFGRTDEEFDDAVEDLSLSADLGAGVEFSLPGTGLNLMPELRYTFGVTDYLSESFQVGGSTIQPSDDERRLSEVMLRLNVLF